MRGSEDVVLVAAAELRSLMETAHLLRSPKNTQRLLTALLRAQNQELPSETVEALRREFDLGKAAVKRRSDLGPKSSRLPAGIPGGSPLLD